MPRPRYPSFMARATRALRENLKRVDLVIEVADARAPVSSRHPEGDRLFAALPRVLALNRADLADPALTARWLETLGPSRGGARGVAAVATSASRGWGVSELAARVRQMAPAGAAGRVRAMVVGLPNLGKSALINRLAGSRKAPTGALPGVTRGQNWVAAGEHLLVLDLPGILYPRPRGPDAYFRLAVLGILDPAEYEPEAAAQWLLRWLGASAPGALAGRFGVGGIGAPAGLEPAAALVAVARARGCLGPGGGPDLARAARALLKDFGQGLLGRFTLETPAGGTPAAEVPGSGRERVAGVEDSAGGGRLWESGR